MVYGDPPPGTETAFGRSYAPGALGSGVDTRGQSWAQFGLTASTAGALLNTISTFTAALNRRDALKTQAEMLVFEQSQAAQAARQAEDDANLEMEAAKEEIGLLGLRTASEKASLRVDAAGRGVTVGQGSAAEVQASVELASRIDALTIRRNAVRRASAMRRQATNVRVSGVMAGLGADNLRRSANTIRPELAGLSAGLGSAGQVSSQYADYIRRYG